MGRWLAAFVALALALPAAAQYPERAVTLLAGYPPGGLVDIVSRLIAEGMKPRFPKGLAVVNRPGAAGAVAVAEVARATPDGYTIVLTPQSALVIVAQLQDLAYKTPDDYDAFINLVAYYPMIAVRSESEYKTIQELIADAKANPGKIRVGSPGCATTASMCPPRSAGLDCAQPWNGTCTICVPVRYISSSRFRWLEVPSPGEPMRSLPGFALASAISSWIVLYSDSERTAMNG